MITINLCLFVKHKFPHPAAKDFTCYGAELHMNFLQPSGEYDKYMSTIIVYWGEDQWDCFEMVHKISAIEDRPDDDVGRDAKEVAEMLINKMIERMASVGIDIRGVAINYMSYKDSYPLNLHAIKRPDFNPAPATRH